MSGATLKGDLVRLNECSHEELVAVWNRHLRGHAPVHLPKALLARILAYRLQEQRYGGLPKEALAYLSKLEIALRAGTDPEAPPATAKQMMPGTLLVREHEGIMQRVMVLEGGFAWNGRTFQSLSAVAKAITGTQWNGRRFFGLKAGAEGME